MIKFLRLTQKKKWELYEKKYGAQTEDRLYNVLQDKIHERGLIWVLRNGIDDLGFKFKLVYFEPASPLNEELNLHYQQNIMECTRQFAYSTQNHNTIDMVLSVNGIPVVALELKNQLTGQNVENSRASYYSYYTGKKWGSAESYDLCINTSLLGLKRTEELVRDYVKQRYSL